MAILRKTNKVVHKREIYKTQAVALTGDKRVTLTKQWLASSRPSWNTIQGSSTGRWTGSTTTS